MKPSVFWKNFQLVEEVSISGNFIYNGLRRFHEMRNFECGDEIFEVFYNLSVGLERLFKIAIVLFEHNDSVDQEKLEKSLITHNHLDLYNRLKKNCKELNFGSVHLGLLELMRKFYKSQRYDRFSLRSVYKLNKEKKSILNFLSKHLEVDFSETSILGISNKDRFKKFFHKHVIKISKTVYEIIKERAMQIGLNTYELRHGSKAESIFLRKVKISDEDILWKELLIFFMNTKESSGYINFLREISPLDFDPGCIEQYLSCFRSDSSKSLVMDELECHYEELEKEAKKRLELISIIGKNLYFEENEDNNWNIDE